MTVENSFALDGMIKALEANLWMLNTIGKGPGESNLDYRKVYDGIPINPELVSIMDQGALDLEMSDGNLAEGFVVKNISDYDQPLEWEVPDGEVIPTDSLSGEFGTLIRVRGSMEGSAPLSWKDKDSLADAIGAIRSYLKYAATAGGDNIQFLPGGMLCIPRLKKELYRLRKVYDLGEQVDVEGEISEIRILGRGNRPIGEFYGCPVFSPEGQSLEESVRECVIGVPFTADYDMVTTLAEMYQASAVIKQLVEFVVRSNELVNPVLEIINNSNDIKEEEIPRLLQTLGNHNIKPPDFTRISDMIITLKYIMDTKDGRVNTDDPPL